MGVTREPLGWCGRTAPAREWLIVTLTAATVAVVATWPMAARFGSAGRLDSGDGRYSVWNVVWVANALTTHPSTVWDANIFYPRADTLAFSEANLVAGVLAVPAWVVTKNPYAASNSVVMLAFVLSALAMYALARRITQSAAAASLGGLLYAFSAYMLAHVPHVQLLMTFSLPLVLLALHRFVAGPSVRAAVWLGLAMALAALSCGYYGIFGGLAVGLGIMWFGHWTHRWRDPRYWLLAALALFVSVVVVSPFFVPYVGVRTEGFTRSIEEARQFRAGWRAYLASPLLVHRWLLPWLGTWREVLFPGFLAIVLSAGAVVASIRSGPRALLPTQAHVLGFYLVLALLAMWASFGPDAGLYGVLFRVVPFMSMLRAPARLGVLVTLGLVAAASIGFAVVERRFAGRGRKVFVAIVLAYALARSTAGRLAIVSAPPVAAAYVALRTLPRAAVAEFPYFSTSVDLNRHTEYMLMSLQHWQPLLNGYSDFIPPAEWADTQQLATFPSPEAWRVLQRRGARYLVIHWDSYEAGERRRIREYVARSGRYMRPIVADSTSLYEIVDWPL